MNTHRMNLAKLAAKYQFLQSGLVHLFISSIARGQSIILKYKSKSYVKRKQENGELTYDTISTTNADMRNLDNVNKKTSGMIIR